MIHYECFSGLLSLHIGSIGFWQIILLKKLGENLFLTTEFTGSRNMKGKTFSDSCHHDNHKFNGYPSVTIQILIQTRFS